MPKVLNNTCMYTLILETSGKTNDIEYLPSSLRLFLHTLFVGDRTDRRVASIGQCMLQIFDQRQSDHLFRLDYLSCCIMSLSCLFLSGILCAMGVRSLYYKTKLLERNISVSDSTNIEELKGTSFIQHIAGNVGHSVRTLDDNNTFHGMGIIVSLTPLLRS